MLMLAKVAVVLVLIGFSEGCNDKASHCTFWKRSGYCEKSSMWYNYMKGNCEKTCGKCVIPTVDKFPGCVDKSSYCSSYNSYCQDPSYIDYLQTNCKRTCNFCPTVDKFPGCVDKSSYCSSYNSYCQDPSYIDYLQTNCKRTCNFCHITTAPLPTTKPITTDVYTVPGGSASLQPGCGKKGPGHTRIVGGKAAKPGDWPWIVTFDYTKNTGNPGHHCGGTLLTDEWILSAAHCFYDDKDKSQYSLQLGEHDLRTDSGNEQRIPIADIIFHPSYNPKNYDSDIALVRLSRKATLNDRVRTACLPDQNTTFATGTKCYIAGWGLLEAYGRGPKILQQAQVPLVSHSTCQAAYPYNKLSGNMLCAGYAAGLIDACQGDSGGPLVCKDNKDTWFLWGVVSWGVGCGRENSYGVYAKTITLRRWIDKIVFNI